MAGKTFRLRIWFNKLPIEDPIQRQMGILLQIILLGFITLQVLAVIANLFLASPSMSRLETVIRGIIVISIFSAPLFLLRRGYFRFVALLFIGLFLFLIAYQIFLTDLQSSSNVLSFFTLIIILAGLLVNRNALIITYLVCTGVILFATFQEQDPALRLENIATLGNFILINGLISIFINSFGDAFRRALHSALQREDELKEEIAHRIQAEEKINILNVDLQQQIAELERFTYTVSHDLRNPLVTIKGFLGMLDKDIQENQPERIKKDFQRIAGAADKMNELLSDLLELSRIGRIVNPPVEVDLGKLTQDALELSDARIRNKHVAILVSPDLPTVYGDRLRLREVLENLITNAAKYMGNQADPSIEIGIRNEKNEQIVFVKDNGIGIEERYHTRIFNLFEKLNPTVEGTGIGLALVKRIVETHGGRVWVESEGLGKGSTFYFTIPDNRKVDG